MHWSNKYVQVPYKEKGRDLDGLDCWGLLRLIYSVELGVTLPSYIDQYEKVNRREVTEAILKNRHEEWEEVTEPQEFDGVILLVRNLPVHIGVVVDPDKKDFIHIVKDCHVCVENLTRKKWYNKVLGFMRHKSRA